MLFGKAFRDLHYIDFVNKNTEYCFSCLFFKINHAYLTHFVLCCWLCGSDYRKTAEANTLRHAGKKMNKIAQIAWKLQLKCIFSAQSWMEIIFEVQVSLFNTNIKKDTNKHSLKRKGLDWANMRNVIFNRVYLQCILSALFISISDCMQEWVFWERATSLTSQ